jgi:hypothetical protein
VRAGSGPGGGNGSVGESVDASEERLMASQGEEIEISRRPDFPAHRD